MTQTGTSTPKVFISYRRSESGGHAGRLYDAMVDRFGEPNVFMDIDMQPGLDFVDRITDVVGSCRVLLVVIGPGWARPEPGEPQPRLADPDDFVRLEVATALRRADVTVIPLLVEGAPMPEIDALPEDLRALARRNALELSDTRWRGDVGRLLGVLGTLLGEVSHAPAAAVSSGHTGGSDPAGAAGGPAARPATAGGRLRRRWQIAAIGTVALIVLLAVVLASGSDDPGAKPSPGSAITTSGSGPAVRPVDVPEGCDSAGETQFVRDLEAKTQWDCDAGAAAGVVGPSLTYLEYTNAADAHSGLTGSTSFQLDNGWKACQNPGLQQFYRHEASCVVATANAEEAEGTIELVWHGTGSTVLGHMTFDPPTMLRDAVRAWSQYV